MSVLGRRDPERIYAASRAATFRRLVDVHHFDELDAEHVLARWEREHGVDFSTLNLTPTYWQEAEEWAVEHRRDRLKT